jgi:adenylate cyclase
MKHKKKLLYITLRKYQPTNKNLKTITVVTLLTVLSGVSYSALFENFNPYIAVNGIGMGFIIGFFGSIAEVYFFQTVGKRFKFSSLLISRTFFYVVLIYAAIIFVVVFHEAWIHSRSLLEVLKSDEAKEFLEGGEFFRIFLYASFISFMINFIRQINNLLGQGVLLKYITGKYHQPVEEERIILFLDIDSSTTIAEKLGNRLYHKLLDDFFHDITPAIVASKGMIYQYVGDEVVITWTKKDGLNKANCIKCFLHITALINLQEEKYLERYGLVPKFKGGYHFGKVMTGEIGDIKKEIVFHGDTVNTAARIRSECKQQNKNLLLSGNLLNNLTHIEYLTPESIGKIKLRGKEEEVELFSILEAA